MMVEKVVIMRMKELYEGSAKVEAVPKSRCDVQECGVFCSGEVLMLWVVHIVAPYGALAFEAPNIRVLYGAPNILAHRIIQ